MQSNLLVTILGFMLVSSALEAQTLGPNIPRLFQQTSASPAPPAPVVVQSPYTLNGNTPNFVHFDYNPSILRLSPSDTPLYDVNASIRMWHCGLASNLQTDGIFTTLFRTDQNGGPGQITYGGNGLSVQTLGPSPFLNGYPDLSQSDGLETCATSVITHPDIYNNEVYFLYYECAPQVYAADVAQRMAAFTQVCLATSRDGVSWTKYHDNRYFSNGPSPMVIIDQELPLGSTPDPQGATVHERCNVQFPGTFAISLTHVGCYDASRLHSICDTTGTCTSDPNPNILHYNYDYFRNYGVGHPSAVKLPDGNNNPTQTVRLYFYSGYGVEFLESFDGFHFFNPNLNSQSSYPPPVGTNVRTNMRVYYYPGQIDGCPNQGGFIGTGNAGAAGNYVNLSCDGITWAHDGLCVAPKYFLPNVTTYPTQARPALVSDKNGWITSLNPINVLVSEGPKNSQSAIYRYDGTLTLAVTPLVPPPVSTSFPHLSLTNALNSPVPIISLVSSKALESNISSQPDMYAYVNQPNEQWVISPIGNHYQIQNVSNGLCLGAGLSSCNHAWSQQWDFKDMGANRYEIANVSTGNCLNVNGGSTADGAQVIQYPCGGGAPNELWTFDFYKIENVNTESAGVPGTGRVLEVNGPSFSNGGTVDIFTYFKGATHEQWSIVPASVPGFAYNIVNMRTGLCLEYTGADGGLCGDGIKVDQYQCVPGAMNQAWIIREYLSGGTNQFQILNAGSQRALEVPGGANADGAPVDIWTPVPAGAPHQLWRIANIRLPE